jgi:beta-N-acetylhexosaminidase
VAACAKHFPGHGDTLVDSHLELPVVHGDLGAALEPFRAAIAVGTQAVMTGHLLVPGLDDLPATVSGRVLTGLLRDELGFRGLVLTDALEMRAISGGVGVEEGAVRALAAGADALCLGHDLHEEAVAAVHAAILGAVNDGRLAEERLAEAADRVVRTVRWTAPTTNGAARRDVGAAAARRALHAREATELAGDPLIVELTPGANVAAGELAHGFAELWPGSVGVRVHERPADAEGLLEAAGDRSVVVVARDLARHEWQRRAVADLRAVRPDAVVVETGVPDGTATIDTHGAARVNLQAAVERLGGPTSAAASLYSASSPLPPPTQPASHPLGSA